MLLASVVLNLFGWPPCANQPLLNLLPYHLGSASVDSLVLSCTVLLPALSELPPLLPIVFGQIGFLLVLPVSHLLQR